MLDPPAWFVGAHLSGRSLACRVVGAVVEEQVLLIGVADAEAVITGGVHVELDVTHIVRELEVW